MKKNRTSNSETKLVQPANFRFRLKPSNTGRGDLDSGVIIEEWCGRFMAALTTGKSPFDSPDFTAQCLCVPIV